MELTLNKLTNISTGTEVDSVSEFDDILCLDPLLFIKRNQEMDAHPAPTQLEPTGR